MEAKIEYRFGGCFRTYLNEECEMLSSMLSLGIWVWQKFMNIVRIQEKLLYRQEQWDILYLSIFIRVFSLRRQMFTALVW